VTLVFHQTVQEANQCEESRNGCAEGRQGRHGDLDYGGSPECTFSVRSLLLSRKCKACMLCTEQLLRLGPPVLVVVARGDQGRASLCAVAARTAGVSPSLCRLPDVRDEYLNAPARSAAC
jgi:hypothetical protein